MYMPNIYYWENQGRLAEKIGQATGWDGRCFFCNSGAESVEGAIKLARLATPEGRQKIVTFERGFHGRTLATLTATAQPKAQKGVGPLPEGFAYATFNDLASVEALVGDDTAAVIVEPVQGEGGIWPATPEFLQGLRRLCDQRGALLVCDEVWTGVGRSGRWFAHQHYDVAPDIMTLAKGIGGGAVLAAVVARPEVAQALVPGMHATTYGGSPLATAAGRAVFEIIEQEGLLENARAMGERLEGALRAVGERTGRIDEIRALGLMVGAQLSVPGAAVVRAALENGLLINCAHQTTIRFAPALNVTPAEIDEGVEIFEQALREAPEDEPPP
jgi:acetylornithine/succinyldiaminopimelate/putrescine aminotransferase